MRHTEPDRADWPRVASSRIDAVNAEATAERVRAIGDLARERLTGFLDSPIGDAARARVAEMLSSTGGRANGAQRRASR